MNELPCKNPSCKSYGKMHPNCRCYSYAEGGEVSHFCAEDRDHRHDCELHNNWMKAEPIHHLDKLAGYLLHKGLHGAIKAHEEEDQHHYDRAYIKGHNKAKAHIQALFKGGEIKHEDTERHRKHIHDWIEKGGIAHDLQQHIYKQHEALNMAEGGEANAMELHKPLENILMQQAKTKASQYLNSIRPQNQPAALAYDSKPDQTNQKKDYDKALHIAAHPLSIVHEIQKGTLEPKQMVHLNSMYPEVSDYLQKEMTKKIIEDQMAGKRPNHKIRQSLGMFLNAPLSSEFKPANIAAAQAAVSGKAQGQQAQQGPSKGASNKPQGSKHALSKSDQSYLTGGQAVVARQQMQH